MRDPVQVRRVGLRWGLLLEAMRSAREAFKVARECSDLVGGASWSGKESIRDCIIRLRDEIEGLETELWSLESRVAQDMAPPRRKKP